ncbi:MAG: HEAT repeat domain-containing protein [Gemmataceae bacterium]|nr:HEAT repeat domain-containing protein [Gemmataceae bacterium]
MFRTAAILLIGLASLLALPLRAPGGTEVGGKRTAEWLKILLADKEAKQRRRALIALEIIGPKGDRVLQGLTIALRQETDSELRREVAQTLGRMGEDARSAIPDLTQSLSGDKHGPVREAAAKALGEMGALAKKAIPTLAAALKDSHPGTRTAAAAALKGLAGEIESVLTQVLDLIKDGKDANSPPVARVYAAQMIGQLGIRAPVVVPVLTAVMADEGDHPQVRQAVADALARFEFRAEEAAKPLARAAVDTKAPIDLRRSALMALGKVTTDPKVVWPAAKAALDDKDATLRAQAVRVAGPVGRAEQEVVPTLARVAQKDKNIEVRLAAIQELGALGGAAKSAQKALQELANTDPRPAVRDAASAALKLIRPTP